MILLLIRKESIYIDYDIADLCPFTNAPNSHSLPIQLEFEWDPFKFKTAWNVNASHSTTTQLPFTPIHKPNSHSTVEFESLPFEKSIHLNGNLMVNFELPPINNTSLNTIKALHKNCPL